MKWSYPFLASYLVVLVDRLSHLGILASFQIVAFLSFASPSRLCVPREPTFKVWIGILR